MSDEEEAGRPVGDAIRQRIREVRKSLRLTQEELAARSGVSVQILYKMESRRGGRVDVDHLAAIAAGLGVPVADLWPEAVMQAAAPQAIRLDLSFSPESSDLFLKAIRDAVKGRKPKEEP